MSQWWNQMLSFCLHVIHSLFLVAVVVVLCYSEITYFCDLQFLLLVSVYFCVEMIYFGFWHSKHEIRLK
jgi:hypothetical protein